MIALPDAKFPMRSRISYIPEWLSYSDLELACCNLATHSDLEAAIQLIRELRVARVQMDNLSEGRPPLVPSPEFLPQYGNDPPLSPSLSQVNDPRVMAATARLAYGELLEAAARARALAVCSPTEIPAPSNKTLRRELARIFFDSYHAAVWTTAHAEYLVHLGDLMASTSNRCTSYDVQPPIPSPLMVPHAVFSMPDLSVLLSRKCDGGSKASVYKKTEAMTQLLSHCTNSGSRSWDPALATAVKECEGCARICRLSILSALTGLHPNIHPSSRPIWETRSKVFHMVMGMGDGRRLVCASPNASKEAMRLYLAAILSQIPANREALLAASHPAGRLVMSPLDLPMPAMLAAMASLAETGKALLGANDPKTILSTISDALPEDLHPKRFTASKRSSEAMLGLTYTKFWLGRSNPPINRVTTLVDEVSSFCFAVFKADFVPLWQKSWTAGTRLSRLDSAQHATMVKRNPVQKLIDSLPEDRRLYVQRLALCTPNAELLDIATVADLLCHPEPPHVGRKQSTIGAITDANVAAELIHFAKITALRSEITTWYLGERTRRMQLRAICRRQMISGLGDDAPNGEILARLPLYSTHILVCAECRRVSNACCDHTATHIGFNEIGISSCMFRVDDELCQGHMRCAKRSSAALRTAIQLEEEAKQSMCGVCDSAPRSTALVIYNSSAMLTKLRRDQKTVFDQVGAVVSCGNQPLVHIPVLGHVIRIFGNFYSLCSICGCLCKVSASNRFGADICCLHCDADMLSRNCQEELADYRATHMKVEPKRHCRFCGKPDSSPLASTKWKTIGAPLDSTGANKHVPYPLRSVTYCPAHYKSWLPAAHKELSTEEIFSHLLAKAKPITGANNSKRRIEEGVVAHRSGAESKPKKQRRVNMLKRKASVS